MHAASNTTASLYISTTCSISSSQKLIGPAEYESFRQKHFIIKKEKLDDIIKCMKVLPFSSKDKSEANIKVNVEKVKRSLKKLLTKFTCEFDIVKSRGVELKEFLE